MADVEPDFGELDTPVPAYAASVTRAKARNTRPRLIPVMTQHYAMLQRNLLYTAAVERKTDVRVSATAPPATTARTAMFVTSWLCLVV